MWTSNFIIGPQELKIDYAYKLKYKFYNLKKNINIEGSATGEYFEYFF